MQKFLPVIVLMALICTTPGYAHHPVAVVYHTDHTETLRGQLVEFQIRNPHSIVLLDGRSPATGQSQRWAVEWLAALQLKHQGVTDTTLRAGDQLLITGYPSQNPNDRRLRLRTIVRPSDGWHWKGTFE